MLPVGEWRPRVPPYDFVKLVEADNAYHRERDRIGHQLASDEEITLITGILSGNTCFYCFFAQWHDDSVE